MSTLPPYNPAGSHALNASRSLIWALVAGGLYGVLWAFSLPNYVLLAFIPLALLALLVIWVLPTSANPPVRSLEIGFFAFFVGLVLWPNYLAISLPGLPWITLIRFIVLPMTFLLLVCASVSPEFRRSIREVLASSPWIAIFFVAFIVLQFLSIGLSRDMPSSVQKFIVSQLYWTAIFFTGCFIFRKPGRIEVWSALLCLMLVPLGIIGLMEQAREQVPWANSIPWFLAVEDEFVSRILDAKARLGTGEYRVQSKFTTSLTYAEYMALTVPFLLHFMMENYRLLIRFLAAALIVFTFYMIIATDSRLGVVGFFMSLLVYILFWACRLWLRNRKSLVAPAVVLSYPVVLVSFLMATFYSGRLRNIVWGSGQHRPSNESRMEQYDRGLELLSQNPLGHGAGQSPVVLNFQNLAGVVTIDTHYISTALEYGVLGFVAYYGMFLIAVYKGSAVAVTERDRRELSYAVPLLTAISVFIVIKSILSLEENHPLVYMMLAMVVVIVHKAKVVQSSARTTG